MTSNPTDVQDIVVRLRDDNSDQPYTERHEAAAEIERLRAALQQSQSAVTDSMCFHAGNVFRHALTSGMSAPEAMRAALESALSQESANA